MSNEKFTPGEWRVESFYYETGKRVVYEIIYNEDGDRVVESIDKKEDASLIAAAPEMYRMLEQLHGALQSVPVLQVEIENLLKKARGEE